jgi:hypothetical protein
VIRVEAYAVLDGLVLHVAAHNLRKTSSEEGVNGMSVHRVIPTETLEERGVEDALMTELVSIFRLYAGLAHYALR